MTTNEQLQQQINSIVTWINSVVDNSKPLTGLENLPQALTDDNFILIQEDEVDDAKRISVSKIRGYLGDYDALNNEPSLSDSQGISGDTYEVSVGGTQDFGSGEIELEPTDLLAYINGRWRKTVLISEYVQDIVAGQNVVIDKTDPLKPVVSSTTTTSAGILSRTYLTGDEETTTEGTFYLSNPDDRGTVASVQQVVINDDNVKSWFPQDVLGLVRPQDLEFKKGDYSGFLSISATGNPKSEESKKRFTAELYIADADGTPRDSGVAGQPIGDLGFQVVAILDSGEISINNNTELSINIAGSLADDFTVLAGERTRIHVSAEKIGTQGGEVTMSLFYGQDHNSYLQVPVPITTDDVINNSNVSGVNTTMALDGLLLELGGKLDTIVAGESITIDFTNPNSPIINAEKSVFAPADIKLTPNYGLPSSTQDVVIQAKNINDATIVSFGAGVTVNSQKVELNDFGALIVRANVTHSANEGAVDVTINNGISTVFSGAYGTINGTLHVPSNDDWKDVSPLLDVSVGGAVSLISVGALQSATYTRIIEVSKDWSLEWVAKRNPLTNAVSHVSDYAIEIGLLSDGSRQISWGTTLRVDSINGYAQLWLQDKWVDNRYEDLGIKYKLVCKNNVTSFYKDGVLKSTSSVLQEEDWELKVNLKIYDLSLLRYTDLSTAGTPEQYDDNYAKSVDLKPIIVQDKDGVEQFTVDPKEDEAIQFEGVTFDEANKRIIPVGANAPYLSDFIPDTYLPSTTGNFIVRGDFFTPAMIDNINSTDGILVEGHTINYATFINSTEIRINLMTSDIEGNYDLTLNNGLQVLFPDVLQVINGTVYKPESGDWIDIGGTPNLTEFGNFKLSTWNSYQSGAWNQRLDYTKDWEISWNFEDSPFGSPRGASEYRVPHIVLKNISNGESQIIWNAKQESTLYKNEVSSTTDGWANPIYANYSNEEQVAKWYGERFKIKHISGILYLYQGNSLKRTFTNSLTEDVRMAIQVKTFNITNIKYIDLSDGSGDLQDTRTKTSELRNDGEDGTSRYVEASELDNLAGVKKTFFIDGTNGDDNTGVLGDYSKPFQSIDACVALFSSGQYELNFIKEGTYEWNSQIDSTSHNGLVIKSDFKVFIDFSNNPNDRLSSNLTGSNSPISFYLPNGGITRTSTTKFRINAEGTDSNPSDYVLGELYFDALNTSENFYLLNARIFHVAKLKTNTSDMFRYGSIQDLEVGHLIAFGTGELRFEYGSVIDRMTIHKITLEDGKTITPYVETKNIYLGDIEGAGTVKIASYVGSGGNKVFFNNSKITCTSFILGVQGVGNTEISGAISPSSTTPITSSNMRSGNITYKNFSADFKSGTIDLFHSVNVFFENCNIKSNGSLIKVHTFASNVSSVSILNSHFKMATPSTLYVGTADDGYTHTLSYHNVSGNFTGWTTNDGHPDLVLIDLDTTKQVQIGADSTLNSGYNHKIIWLNPTLPITITVDDTLSDNFECEFINISANDVTFVAGTGVLNSPDGLVLSQNKVATLLKRLNNNDYWLKGELS